uniref:tetratricopeptide repeat protein n=1 Tax=uncultured Nostoc sp. TaxID=340711 RepID=UPI0035C9E8C3
NQALRINPNDALAYYNRGIFRADLGDKKGAITDLQQAADIFKQQGKIENYQKALEIINRLQK